MKRIVYLSCLSMTMIMLFAACKSNKSLNQRHYNNRYYIGMSKSEEAPELLVASEKTPEEHVAKSEDSGIPQSEKNAAVGVIEYKADQTGDIRFNKKNTASENGAGPLNTRFREKGIADHYPHALLKKTTDVKNNLAPSSTSDALSLLWIVIVILLIIWLIGLVFGSFGIGGAIHILALIALILLILWLLRVI